LATKQSKTEYPPFGGEKKGVSKLQFFESVKGPHANQGRQAFLHRSNTGAKRRLRKALALRNERTFQTAFGGKNQSTQPKKKELWEGAAQDYI